MATEETNGAVAARLAAMEAEWRRLEEASAQTGLRPVPGGVCAPRGFRAAGVHGGLKRRRKDLALVLSEVPATAAATFTTNRVQAAPVQLTREHVKGGRLQAIVCNSGNANACNGPQGLADARRMAEETAAALGIPPEYVAVASTGVIGVPLPMDKVVAAIREAASRLDTQGNRDAAEAIMTTDTVPKEVAVALDIGGVCVTVGGMAKGSGMIHPNMATMLAFITTDAAVERELLQELVSRAVDDTFNMISVDGDTSTNDMVVCLANGLAGNAPLTRADEDGARALANALRWVMGYLARAIARDGEGATRLVEVRVEGAPDRDTARRIARSVASSNLVKAAVHGRDANWGRILCAAGYAGVDFDPDRVDVAIGGVQVASAGRGLPFDEHRAWEALGQDEVVITLNLNAGTASAVAWTCDLSADYVRINASYRS